MERNLFQEPSSFSGTVFLKSGGVLLARAVQLVLVRSDICVQNPGGRQWRYSQALSQFLDEEIMHIVRRAMCHCGSQSNCIGRAAPSRMHASARADAVKSMRSDLHCAARVRARRRTRDDGVHCVAYLAAWSWGHLSARGYRS